MTHSIKNWRKDFDEKFKVDYQWRDDEYVDIAKWGDIKAFIASLLNEAADDIPKFGIGLSIVKTENTEYEKGYYGGLADAASHLRMLATDLPTKTSSCCDKCAIHETNHGNPMNGCTNSYCECHLPTKTTEV